MKSPLLQSLFDEEERTPLTVSEVTTRVKNVLERSFKSVWLEGEIVNFSAAASGHWYFNLRDEFSQLRAACYRGANSRIKFQPFDGLQVRVSGKLTVYEPKGEYQILVESLDPVGEGAMKVAFEQLKTKLEREGLFAAELKRPLPFFPKRVGIITSPNGAAIHDILHVLARRTRTVDVLFLPTRVQGESAPLEIRDAIELANELHFDSLRNGSAENLIDVLIIGRGGGAMEDLWAFNDERVARAIRNSLIPIISAVGHETDFTIADFVADFRAPTPSAAAEIVAAQESQIAAFLAERTEDLFQAIEFRLLAAKSKFQDARSSRVFAEFPARILRERNRVEKNLQRLQNSFVNKTRQNARRLDNLQARLSPAILKTRFVRADANLQLLRQKLDRRVKNKFDTAGENFGLAAAKLDALSPLGVLRRGYALAQKDDGTVISNIEQIAEQENLKIRLANGKLDCRVISVEMDSIKD
ncbi:MAG: exodeoxyribonuclease VII large subunit [Pyrinomonadaceae bacterium]